MMMMKLLMISNTDIFFNSLLINYKSTDRNKELLQSVLRVYSQRHHHSS